MKRLLLKTSVFLLLCSSFLALNTELYGQSNPVPFELGSGTYEFTAWNSASPSGLTGRSRIDPAGSGFHASDPDEVLEYAAATTEVGCRIF